nr:DEAD/DEAH box helicase [Leucobacter luti]
MLPSTQADGIRAGLIHYLGTAFALSSRPEREELERFLTHPERGIFRGPYVRLRTPFQPAADGWREELEWYEGHPPYGHQAQAFARLSSANLSAEKPRPLPTLVTTGTGSGKTEAFLAPILDHVLRAKRAGERGMKALILYPMNALANDQARRLTELITGSAALGGIRAALFTGQAGPERSRVSEAGLITDRAVIREEAPDILLTNYKMLDQLLLRTQDQQLWVQSATSLRYLVLDEFHTYDGAQGTDVAMLLRRLGLALKRHWPDADPDIDGAARARPLGLLTPVATSATLGDKGDPAAMLDFAHTVFGETFAADAVVTETRTSVSEWAGDGATQIAAHGLRERPLTVADVRKLNKAAEAIAASPSLDGLGTLVWGTLYAGWTAEHARLLDADAENGSAEFGAVLSRGHSIVRQLAEDAEQSVAVQDLADRLLSRQLGDLTGEDDRDELAQGFVSHVLAALSQVRAAAGRAALSVDLHLWTRALTRVNRFAAPEPRFVWDDDGPAEETEVIDPFEAEGRPQFPALYCRHCGRSGWGVQLAPTGTDLDTDDTAIRKNHLGGDGRFRALLFAPQEADYAHPADTSLAPEEVEGLRWFWPAERKLLAETPDLNGPDVQQGNVLPVLALGGEHADDRSRDDECPSCGKIDGVRFLGSAIATTLSVAVTTVFGDAALDSAEKKALVFTDSVQDAAHRAGFVQSRSHVFSLRNAIRDAIGTDAATLETVLDQLLAQAGDDAFRRYRLLAPELPEREAFRPFWAQETLRRVPPATMRLVKKRLLFDLAMEFGLQSRVGRTLEMTGSVAAQVDAGPPTSLEAVARTVLEGFTRSATLDDDEPPQLRSETVVRWVRGVLERMRERGAIAHPWFDSYIQHDGSRWQVWGGRPRGEGMPAFPKGREAPGFPRVGGSAREGSDSQRTHLDVVTSSQSWFALWAKKVLRVTPGDGATLSKLLLAELAKQRLIEAASIGGTGATAYLLNPDQIVVEPIDTAAWTATGHLLVCSLCRTQVTVTRQVFGQLLDGPCQVARCPGTLEASAGADNYYRRLYIDGDIRRVVAREHTSLLEDRVRLGYEDAFKAADAEPDAPNVLVATPTLEMGIDIGDLSTVMLAGLPRSVASYLQRVGRAGRLTGNSLSLAFVTGRGEQLPKVHDPLSVINGQVRPPAAYLNAEEILQRQYLASVIDARAAALERAPQHAPDVLRSVAPGSFLGDLVIAAETGAAEHLDRFLAQFADLQPEAEERLRGWATPQGGPGSSELAREVRGAGERWGAERDRLRFRRDEIQASLGELEDAADRPAKTLDDISALRSANAALRMILRLIQAQRLEHWVSALERFGLLPNYTLLDDTVRLDVALSWVDPETREFQHEGVNYDRGAAVAIQELAPGATFYAQGMEIEIDAVDLGVDGEAISEWSFCPACGYAHEHLLTELGAQCPRCGARGIADSAQRLNVVELTQVSAEVRRDEATISDRRDERTRVQFSVPVLADIDDAEVLREWYLPETGFGVKYLRGLTVRWLNLGKLGGFSTQRMLAGEETAAPLFRVCRSCGKLDTSSRKNSRREHRPWCPHRDSTEEHAVQIALSRTLRTQGVLLRLPTSITLGDSLALPSLVAALMLGLRESLGGDPDHLRVLTAPDPVPESGGESIPSLLLHDSVPGGTGYLAELARPERVREILESALRVIRACPCRTEHRAACHLCILPYAPGGADKLVSRASAERSLLTLLQIRIADDRSETVVPWDWTARDPGLVSSESVLEQLFRKVFMDRARSLGGAVKEIAGDRGNRIQVSMPGSSFVWELQPQVDVAGSRPDFVLQAMGGSARSIAIFTDGLAYHASQAHNRLADDALKRRALRDAGYLVLGISWQDLERANSGTPEPPVDWFAAEAATEVTGTLGISLGSLDHITANPIDQLMDWVQDPGAALGKWERVAAGLAALLLASGGCEIVTVSGDSSSAALESLADQEAFRAHKGAPVGWQLRREALVFVSTLQSGSPNRTASALVLDDRHAALGSAQFDDSWRLWLRLSNVLGVTHGSHQPVIGVYSALAARRDDAVAGQPHSDHLASDPATGEVSPEWRPLLTEEFAELHALETTERQLLRALAAIGTIPTPDVGAELGDGIPVLLAWPERQVCAGEFSAEDREELVSLGWVVVGLDPDDIVTACEGTER